MKKVTKNDTKKNTKTVTKVTKKDTNTLTAVDAMDKFVSVVKSKHNDISSGSHLSDFCIASFSMLSHFQTFNVHDFLRHPLLQSHEVPSDKIIEWFGLFTKTLVDIGKLKEIPNYIFDDVIFVVQR